MSPKERQIEVQGTEIYVMDSARRGLKPVVAVHGWAGGDHLTLRGTPGFDGIDGRTRAVFYDLRGTGRSGGWDEGAAPSIEHHGADLAALLETMNLERPIVVGHDIGAAIVLRLALDQPAAVSGVVLVCPRLGSTSDARAAFEEKAGEMLEGVDVPELLGAAEHDPDVAFRKAMEQIFPLGCLRFGLTERAFMKRITFRRRAYDEMWAALAGCTMHERLGELHIPALVLAGRYDPFIDLSETREMAERMPGARFVLFHESAHWPFLEEPVAFADEIWDWVEEVAAHIL